MKDKIINKIWLRIAEKKLNQIPNLFVCLLLLFMMINCQSKTNSSTSETIPYAIFSNPWNTAWKEKINQGVAIKENYLDKALKILPTGRIITSNVAIDSFYKKLGIKIDSIQVIKNIQAHSGKSIDYEIGTFWTTDQQQYKHLVIWNGGKENKKRELEFIAKCSPSPNITEAINSSRAKWIALCNQHNAQQLVEQAYTSNALYYNHKPLILGLQDITVEYQYMNRENYSLHLEPIIVESVNADLAFEIGQCSGSYKGKYIIIWERQKDENWQVLMDSNI